MLDNMTLNEREVSEELYQSSIDVAGRLLFNNEILLVAAGFCGCRSPDRGDDALRMETD